MEIEIDNSTTSQLWNNRKPSKLRSKTNPMSIETQANNDERRETRGHQNSTSSIRFQRPGPRMHQNPPFHQKRPRPSFRKNNHTRPSTQRNQHQNKYSEAKKQRYKILEELGRGTFGVVNKAQDKESDEEKFLAIKKVLQEPLYHHREFSITSQLSHPNCIPILDHFYTRESNWDNQEEYLNLVMPYYKQNLYKVLRYYRSRTMDFPPSLAKIYIYQMFRALGYLKSQGIIHRDLKPQNILVNAQTQQLVFCDFGSAKRIEKGQLSTSYICSRFYRPPELILGQEIYDETVDMWSIGCVISEIFIGTPIFPGQNTKDQMDRICQVLGNPTNEQIFQMCGKKNKFQLVKCRRMGLSTQFRTNIDPLVLDLLEKIFVYNPKKRIKPLEALLHPYFDELRNQRLTVNGKEMIELFDFSEEELQFYEAEAEAEAEDVRRRKIRKVRCKLMPFWFRAEKFEKENPGKFYTND